MEAIANHLRDPDWWFTAIVIGTVVSIGAAFGKEYLTEYFEEARELKRERIRAWSKSASLLIISWLYAISQLIYAILAGFSLNILILQTGRGETLSFLIIIAGATCFLALLFYLWSATRNLLHCLDCLREFGISRKLPPLP